MKKKRVLLLGPMPPPAGGVSVHLQRLLESSLRLRSGTALRLRSGTTLRLRSGTSKHSNLQLAVFDIRRMKIFFDDGSSSNFISMIIYFFRSDILHIHWSHPMKVIAAFIGRITSKKILITIHNPREMSSWSSNKTMKLAYKTIFVFDPGKLPLNGIIIPAFIRPDKNLPLPENLTSELSKYVHVLISVSSASKRMGNGIDMYGFDIILKAIQNIDRPAETVLILIDTGGNLKSNYETLIRQIEKEKCIRIIYLTEEINFPELLSKCSMFLRATRSDGDSISVREALSTGVTVLVSDCVVRPLGCILFKDGDAEDLSQKIMEHLFNPKKLKFTQSDFSEVLFELYRNL